MTTALAAPAPASTGPATTAPATTASATTATGSASTGAGRTRTAPAVPRPRSRPYLAPVPQCEPAYDDEPAASRNGRSPRRTVRPAVTNPVRPSATSAGPSATPPDPAPGCHPAASAVTTSALQTVVPPRLVPLPQPARPFLPTRPAESDPSARSAPHRVAVISAADVPGWSKDSDVGVQLTTSAALPPAGRVGPALATAVIEVLSGFRALGQLRAHCAPDVFAGLGNQPVGRRPEMPRLISTRVCEPADGVAEVSAVFRGSGRVRALAMRLQGVDGRWRVTALQVG